MPTQNGDTRRTNWYLLSTYLHSHKIHTYAKYITILLCFYIDINDKLYSMRISYVKILL